MVGLVFVDALMLSTAQWLALVLSMGIVLWRGVSWRVLLYVHALLLAAFWNAVISIDTRLLFQSCAYLQPFSWSAFLSEFAFRDYVKLQPPFYTFWISRWPSLPLHQLLQSLLALGCGILMLELYGEQAKYLLSTPLYLLLSTQPGNDFVLFVVILIVLRCLQLRQRCWAALLCGIAFFVKPLMIITLPFLLWQLGYWIVLTIGTISVYLIWTMQYYFGIMQWHFLLQQLLIARFFNR
jgi:hypothetical protein